MYSIYKTINKITGRFYIGKQHKNLNYYLGSGKLLQRAIEKHGLHNFRKVILEDGLTAKQACVREQYWIECTGALMYRCIDFSRLQHGSWWHRWRQQQVY